MKVSAVAILLILILIGFCPNIIAENEDTDYAVAAISDIPILSFQNSNPQMLAASTLKEDINPFPTAEQIRWFDMNRDLEFNDFDLRQFQNIVESLHGERLSGLELSIRFRVAQKNQKESFPILYDLDRDGMFTPYDVDYFTEVINQLDEGNSRGNQLIESLKFQLQASS